MPNQDDITNPKHQLLNQRLDSDIVASLDDLQRDALALALEGAKWSKSHPLNIRLSLPWFKKRLYLTIVGGVEKRSPERLSEERESHPVRTFFNILFAIAIVGGATTLMLIILALYSSIIEF